MPDKLTIYNLALSELNERHLASLTEAREPRRVLDTHWAQEVAYCLGEGQWNFMTRTVQQDASSTVEPGFGFLYAFNLPVDYVRTITCSISPSLQPPMFDNEMAQEAGFLYTNWTPIYHSYVSNDALYGMNLGAWPPAFTDFVAKRLARQTAKKITGSDKLLVGPQGLIAEEKRAKLNARSKDAMNNPTKFAPTGTWVRARRGFMHRMPGAGDEPGGSLMG